MTKQEQCSMAARLPPTRLTSIISMSSKSLTVLMPLQSRILRRKCKTLVKNFHLPQKKVKPHYLKPFGYVIKSLRVLRSRVSTREYSCLLMRIPLAIRTTKIWLSKELMTQALSKWISNYSQCQKLVNKEQLLMLRSFMLIL